jgi:hypothetical protein
LRRASAQRDAVKARSAEKMVVRSAKNISVFE